MVVEQWGNKFRLNTQEKENLPMQKNNFVPRNQRSVHTSFRKQKSRADVVQQLQKVQNHSSSYFTIKPSNAIDNHENY